MLEMIPSFLIFFAVVSFTMNFFQSRSTYSFRIGTYWSKRNKDGSTSSGCKNNSRIIQRNLSKGTLSNIAPTFYVYNNPNDPRYPSAAGEINATLKTSKTIRL